MTCRECELLVAGEVRNEAVESHLSGCAECRALAEELRENAVAFGAMAEEELVLGLKAPLQAKARATRSLWIGAAAAALLLLAPQQVSRQRAPEAPPPAAPPLVPPPLVAKARKPFRKRPRVPTETARAEPLMVKMLTPDPEVVIYWLVEPKERSE